MCLEIGLEGKENGGERAGGLIGQVTLSLQVHAHIIQSTIDTIILWPCWSFIIIQDLGLGIEPPVY